MASSVQHEIKKIVRELLESGQWEEVPGKNHGKLRFKPNGRLVQFACTSKNWHAPENLRRDARRVMRMT